MKSYPKIHLAICLCLMATPIMAETLTFSLVGVDAHTKGFNIAQQLADNLGDRCNQDISLKSMPAKRADKLLEAGDLDGAWSRVIGLEKRVKNIHRIIEPIANHPYIAYSVKTDIKTAGWESLQSYKVSYQRGWTVIANHLAADHPALSALQNAKAAIRFLQAGRADVFISIPYIMDDLLESEEFTGNQIIANQPPIDFLDLYNYLHTRHKALEQPMQQCILDMKLDGSYDRIRQTTDIRTYR